MTNRADVVQATVDKYFGKPFSWSRGITCIHLARYHARQMGHAVPTMPRFRSVLGAKRALAEKGFSTVSELLDSLFPRIAPAEAWLGDLMTFDGEDGMEGTAVFVGNGRVLSWHRAAVGAAIFQPFEYNSAWRL